MSHPAEKVGHVIESDPDRCASCLGIGDALKVRCPGPVSDEERAARGFPPRTVTFIDRTAEALGGGFQIIGVPTPQGVKGPPATWPEFTMRFTDILRGLGDGKYVVANVQGTANRFVQFMGLGERGMKCESVSNAYLAEGRRLTDSECQRLVEMGWSAPNGSPNYHLALARPVAFEEAAALATRTLVEIHKAKSPDNLLLHFA